MRYTDKITIENPSRKLEERLREIGVRKYLRLKKLAKDDMSSAKYLRLKKLAKDDMSSAKVITI